MIPVILLGGILTGWFTPTEAGVVAVIWIIVVVIPALNRGHFSENSLRFLPGRADLLAAADHHRRRQRLRLDAGVSARRHRDRRLDHLACRQRSASDDAAAGAAVHRGRRFHRAGADHHHLHAAGERADAGRRHQRRPYGRGADRDAGVRTDHAALRAGAADGVEIRRRQFCQSVARGAADLCGVPGDHHVYDLFPEGGAVAAEAGDPGIGRLLQVAGGDGVYLPELSNAVVPANEAVNLSEGAVAVAVAVAAVGGFSGAVGHAVEAAIALTAG